MTGFQQDASRESDVLNRIADALEIANAIAVALNDGKLEYTVVKDGNGHEVVTHVKRIDDTIVMGRS